MTRQEMILEMWIQSATERQQTINELRARVAELEAQYVVHVRFVDVNKRLTKRLAEAERLVEQLLNEYEGAAGGPRDQSEEEAVLIHDARAFLAAGDTAKEGER